MDLNQVTVPATDMVRSIDFYRTLGLRLIVEAPHYARFECPEGAATFSIHTVDQAPVGEGIVVYFECAALDQQVADLQQKSISFDELPNDKPWLWREAHLRDPDGNRLILFHAGDNRKNPPWRLPH